MKFKYYFLITFGFLFSQYVAQIPTGYYDKTAGATGFTLKTRLFEIISPHTDIGYGGLWTCYANSDIDKYFEKNNSILDMYSEKPTSKDSYEFVYQTGQCGQSAQKNYEGSCYNREHSLPKSYFGGINATPMANDAHFVIPTDYYVNGQRGNYLYGETSNPTKTFSNGTKIGPSSVSGYSGTVFEPIDEFKGDFARMYLYFVTCYEDKLSGFYNLGVSGTPFDGSKDRGFQPWIINLLLKWSAQDPVSPKEIDRNNAVYAKQRNRNPYIDHPEWVQLVWGNLTLEGVAPTAISDLSVATTTGNTASLNYSSATDNVAVAYYKIFVNGVFTQSSTSTSPVIYNLSSGTTYNFYVVAVDTSGNESAVSNTVQATTLATNETNATTNFNIFPNPVKNGELNVTSNSFDKISTVNIYNLNGQLLKTYDKPFKNSNKLNVKQLPKGIYILKADNKSFKIIVE